MDKKIHIEETCGKYAFVFSIDGEVVEDHLVRSEHIQDTIKQLEKVYSDWEID